MRLAGAVGEMERTAILVGQRDRQSIDRVAGQFGGAHWRHAGEDEKQGEKSDEDHGVFPDEVERAQRKPRLTVVSAALSADSMATRISTA